MKFAQLAQILGNFFSVKVLSLKFVNSFGIILGKFFINSSGHPDVILPSNILGLSSRAARLNEFSPFV
jgi:hypothetical protein